MEGNTIGGVISIDGPGNPVVRGNHFVVADGQDDSGVGMSYGGSALIEANEFDDGNITVDTGADPASSTTSSTAPTPNPDAVSARPSG